MKGIAKAAALSVMLGGSLSGCGVAANDAITYARTGDASQTTTVKAAQGANNIKKDACKGATGFTARLCNLGTPTP